MGKTTEFWSTGYAIKFETYLFFTVFNAILDRFLSADKNIYFP